MKSVELIGFDNFDADTVEEVKEKLRPLINKYNKIFGNETIQNFRLASSTRRKEGDQSLHEVTATLNTTKGNYHVVKSGWDILAVVDEIESVLERQVKEKKERLLQERTGRNV